MPPPLLFPSRCAKPCTQTLAVRLLVLLLPADVARSQATRAAPDQAPLPPAPHPSLPSCRHPSTPQEVRAAAMTAATGQIPSPLSPSLSFCQIGCLRGRQPARLRPARAVDLRSTRRGRRVGALWVVPRCSVRRAAVTELRPARWRRSACGRQQLATTQIQTWGGRIWWAGGRLAPCEGSGMAKPAATGRQ